MEKGQQAFTRELNKQLNPLPVYRVWVSLEREPPLYGAYKIAEIKESNPREVRLQLAEAFRNLAVQILRGTDG